MAPTIRTAVVLGAGLGARLKTLTALRPKPLLPVANRPLMTYAFDHLLEAGVERFVVNTHWRPEAYEAAFPEKAYRGAPIEFRHETPEVLETAGGLKNVEDLLGDAPFLVHNGDILSTLPLAPALAHHVEARNEVTLILRSHGGPLQISFDEASGRVVDVARTLDPARAARFVFTGIYVVNPEFLRRIPAGTKISVVPIFCHMIREGAKLGGIVIDEGAWWDLGTREQYLAVHRWLADAPLPAAGAAPWIHPAAEITPTARLLGATAAGNGAKIGTDVCLQDCVIWDAAEIGAGSFLQGCIVTGLNRVTGNHSQVDF